MTETNSPPGAATEGTTADATAASSNGSTAIVSAPRRSDVERRRAIRRDARRRLDELLAGVWMHPNADRFADRGDYWAACHMHLDLQERTALGRELVTAVRRG